MSKLPCFAVVACLSFVCVGPTPVLAQQQPLIRPAAPKQSPANAAPQQPRAPFQLKPEEQAKMDALLDAWEKESDKIKLFRCSFTRWDYDATFGPKANDFLMSERKGEIKFRAPDNGTFKEVSMKQFDPQENKYLDSKEGLEHWVCDGAAIYQFQPKVKTLEITELPPEMRGKAITEGPLPFIFGAKAQTLRQRYWIRETTPKDLVGKQVWLEAWPKFAQQAANFNRVEVILTANDLLPFGMQVFTPNGKDRTAYMFEEPVVNDKVGDFLRGDFLAPRTPFGWKKVVNPASPAASATPEPAAKQATRAPVTGTTRK